MLTFQCHRIHLDFLKNPDEKAVILVFLLNKISLKTITFKVKV